MINLSTLRANPNNPRLIKDDKFKKLCSSVKDFPRMMSLRPIVVDVDGVILGGNMRFQALKHLGYSELPDEWVKRADELTEEERRRFIIEDNVSFGEWDFDILASDWDINELNEWGLDVPEFKSIEEAREDNFEIPDEIETDIVVGDMIEIGPHRLVCGDSTYFDVVEKLMQGEKATLCFTSPPYWVGFTYEQEKEKAPILRHINDAAVNMAMFTNGRIVINTGNISSITTAEKITGKKQPALLIDWWMDALNKNNFLLRHLRIWAKAGGVTPSRVNDKIDMHWEYLAMFADEDHNAGFIATFKNATDNTGQNSGTPEWAVKGVWTDIQGAARGSGHVAAFPVELVSRHIKMYTERGNVLYEPYGGSGTTMVAAHQLGRRCFGIELNPKYCQVIIDRMMALDHLIKVVRNGQPYEK